MRLREDIAQISREAERFAVRAYLRKGRVPCELQRIIHGAKVLKEACDYASRGPKIKYDPDQPRVPAGHPDGGQWTDDEDEEEGYADLSEALIDDPPLRPVYPLESVMLGAFGGRAFSAARALTGILLSPRSTQRGDKDIQQTYHGAQRFKERGFSEKDIRNAIKTAERANQVTEKVGKYGTPQKVYRGTNGVTVIIETSNRNAGKIITMYRSGGKP